MPNPLHGWIKWKPKENWEYIGYDLSYKEFKAHVNVFLKNRRHALKTLIEGGASRPKDYQKEHWESLKHLIASKTKHEEATNNHAMKARVMIPSHFGRGGELGVARKLVRWHTIVIISCSSLLPR